MTLFLWLSWQDAGLAPYTPPTIGGTHKAPPIDPMTLLPSPTSTR